MVVQTISLLTKKLQSSGGNQILRINVNATHVYISDADDVHLESDRHEMCFASCHFNVTCLDTDWSGEEQRRQHCVRYQGAAGDSARRSPGGRAVRDGWDVR